MSNHFEPLPPPLTGQQLANQQRALDALHGVVHSAPVHVNVNIPQATPIHAQDEAVGVATAVPPSQPTPVHKPAHFSPEVLIGCIVLGALYSVVTFFARRLFKRAVGCDCSGQAHVHIVNSNEPQPWE